MNRTRFSHCWSVLCAALLLAGCAAPTSPIPTQEVSTKTPTQTITPSPIATRTPTPSPTATQVPTYTPTPTAVPLTATAIAASNNHTCAVTDRGGVMCWGYNGTGQLGDGTTATRLTPVDVVGLTSGVVSVTAKSWHTCALTVGGGVKCWGGNWSGELGDGTTEQRLTPVDVVGLTFEVVAVSAGGDHTCALLTNGGVKCWGSNESGQLGDGTTEQRHTPVDVVGLTSGVKSISAGYYYTCAVTTSGGAKCWGGNWDGALGDGTTTEQQLTPVDVAGLTSGVKSISAGYYHTCALTIHGGIKCWGVNNHGQLGDGTTEGRHTPVQVLGLTISATDIAAGASHTCARTTSGGVKCWGDNQNGQLGDGTTQQQLAPVQVEGLTSSVMAITAGGGWTWINMVEAHTCALTTSGSIKCWGSNGYGQLGDGSGEGWLTPGEVVGLTGGVTAIDAGNSHTCALTTGWGVKCWGSGRGGDNTSMLTPVDLEGFTRGVTVVSTTGCEGMTCVLSTTSGVTCWRYTCDPEYTDDTEELASEVGAISAGFQHACALTVSGGVKCWGHNYSGQLGDGTSIDRQSPVNVVGLASGVSVISSGGLHTCALLTNGGVKCWGRNFNGQLGDGTTEQRLTPVDVVGLTSGVQAISASMNYTCALMASGGVKCWGSNWSGQLGDGTTEQRLTPVDVMGLTSEVVAIDASNDWHGGRHTCALITSGGVKCWGANEYGQLGDGTSEQRLTPVDVVGLTNGVVAVTVGADHTCALTTEGNVVCWGSNHYGTLGRGTAAIQTTPVDVVGFGP
jgi:alpha-tubulin suppressor-like RCC1 family protein